MLALAQDGATLEQGGLVPRHALQDGPLEQNQARELALAAFPVEARLRKVGMEVHRRRLTLSFDFPLTGAATVCRRDRVADRADRLERAGQPDD